MAAAATTIEQRMRQLTADAAITLPKQLRDDLGKAARTPRLLVACDYDGTLSPATPESPYPLPLPESVGAVRGLATLQQTHVAVVSGRSLRDLASASRLPSEVQLIGGHGSEFETDVVPPLNDIAAETLRRVTETLVDIARDERGVSLEARRSGMVVHLRDCDQQVAKRVIEEIRNGPAGWQGVHTAIDGGRIELSVAADKAATIDLLRQQHSSTATVYLGDGLNDADPFEQLADTDIGIKVGPPGSSARNQLNDPTEAALALAFLYEQRRQWLHGDHAPPIERLTMLANERSVALVTPDGCVNWFCHPEPDSAALFADLLGGPSAGRFSVRSQQGGSPLGQRYLPGTMTVETRWPGLTVTDYLDHQAPPQRTDLIRVISGEKAAVVEFSPRPEFGQVPVRLVEEINGLRVVGTSDPVVLYSPGVDWRIDTDGMHDTARAIVWPEPDQEVVLELRCGADDLAASTETEQLRRARAARYWSSWLSRLRLPETETDLVGRSALTLRGLCHSETGGIMAAATTSLPEEIGGVRNWDYRYCWLRDGAMTAKALLSLGSLAEAEGFLRWLHNVMRTVPGPERLHPLYTLGGAPLGPEAVIETLPGYAGSRPVRIGNLANQQVQLDVFGPVVDLISDLAHERGWLDTADWELVVAMTEAVAQRWHEPDHGIWEEQIRPRQHVYSKVMCWLAVDRALRLADRFGRTPDENWERLRATIAEDVLERGWNAEIGSFTAAYDGTDLDAATLYIGMCGLLDPRDERFQSTVNATEAELRDGPAVYRYHRDDGLPGNEGGFLLCTAWLIEAYVHTGRRSDAEQLFKYLVGAAGPTGLIPEEYDPVSERTLGNHPQAYSHLGLIRCAQLLSAD